jgi:Zn ribbon nucleic-acid-binding protein
MAHREMLIEFFGRYPSALGMSHAGGQYRLICPQCGDLVPVAVLSDDVRQIDVVCYNCGFEDHLTDVVEVQGTDVAPQRANGSAPIIGGFGNGHQSDRALSA